jgi:transposase
MPSKSKRNYKEARVYSADFKENAIQLALRSPSIEVVAKELGIPKPTLYTWINNFKKRQSRKQKAESTQPKLESLQSNVVNLMEENRRLNKTIAALLEEKAILKKAAAYFAKDLK